MYSVNCVDGFIVDRGAVAVEVAHCRKALPADGGEDGKRDWVAQKTQKKRSARMAEGKTHMQTAQLQARDGWRMCGGPKAVDVRL